LHNGVSIAKCVRGAEPGCSNVVAAQVSREDIQVTLGRGLVPCNRKSALKNRDALIASRRHTAAS
jgi:hypothetical protein